MNADKLLSLVDRQMVIDLATEVINTPSPTGEEGEMARVYGRAMKEVGCDVTLQNIYDDRYNAIGRLAGSGGGPNVLFSGHMDTSVRGDEDYLVGRGWKNAAVIDGDRIYGNGIMNMKNALVSYVAGVDALRRAGVSLKGDLIVAGNAGEVEMAPIDEYQGKHYHGYGMGVRFMLIHGVAADYHILGEPTGHRPSTGVMGTVWAKVTTHGDFSHSAYSDVSLSAIDEMRLLWDGLDGWIAQFRERNTFMDVVPPVNRAAIRGGLPWRAARTSNLCSLYIDIRFAPDAYPIDIQREFAAAVQEIAKDKIQRPVDVEFYMARPGTNLPAEHEVVQAIVDANHETTGDHVPAGLCPPYCADAIDSNRLGIPTVIYGAGGGKRLGTDTADPRSAEGEFMVIDDMVTAAATYMNAAMRLNEIEPATMIEMRGPMPGFTP